MAWSNNRVLIGALILYHLVARPKAPSTGDSGLANLFANPKYATLFRTCSPLWLFSAIGSNITEVDFVVPSGGDAPATTRGFGAVFTKGFLG